MTKKEVTQIMAILRAAYPNVKIEDAAAMVEAYFWGLQDCNAGSIAKAARLHITTSKYFPTVAELREKMTRAELVYPDNTGAKIADHSETSNADNADFICYLIDAN